MSAKPEEWIAPPVNHAYANQYPQPAPAPGIGQLAAALAKAQMEMQNPGFDSTNPHFRNKFASLAAVRNAVVPVFAKHGVFISQDVASVDGAVSCTTILSHGSGQQMRFGPLVLPVSKNDAQGFGSAATYARRYSLMAVACVVGDDDDDANAATGKPAYSEPHRPQGDIPKLFNAEAAEKIAIGMRDILEADVDEDVKALHVMDRSDMLNKDQELYVAAADRLNSKERAAWKSYLAAAKKKQAAEPVAANGRRNW